MRESARETTGVLVASSVRWWRLRRKDFRTDLRVSIVEAFLMCSDGEFQTEGPKKEKARLPFVLHL